MQKIVINTCWGGFGLSDEALLRYAEIKGLKLVRVEATDYGNDSFYINEIHDDNYFFDQCIDRNDPCLVQVIEEMGKDASDVYSELKVVEIPDGVEWEIDDYDGRETIEEKHRKWS